MSFLVQTRVTLRDIAVRVGVSHVTVSKALKNHPKVSKEKKELIQKIAKEMGYRPDPALSSLVAYRNAKRRVAITSCLAWINHWQHPEELRRHHEFAAYWEGAFEAAEQMGYRVDEFIWQPEMKAKRLQTILETRNIRGLLIPPHGNQPDLTDLDWSPFSVIRFGLSVRNLNFHVVTSNQLRSVYSSVERLHRYGYRRVGFVIPREMDLVLGGGHLGGFLSAQTLLGLDHRLPPLLLAQPHPKGFAGETAEFQAWFKEHRPDAILTAHPNLPAILAKLKVAVPKKVAVAVTSLADISFDTGIDQNSREIGRVAAQTLISLINSNEQGIPVTPRHILVESKWVDGLSLPKRV